MNLSLPAKTRKQIEHRVRSGKYNSPEEVVAAAIAQLDQREQMGDFEAGELDRLLEDGEKSGKSLDGKKVLRELHQLGRRKQRKWR
jgi:putative addiction module CopG family antidote